MIARRAATTAWPEGPVDGALVPRRRAWVHGVELDSESVLYDERSGRLHFLNWSASAVWWSIDGVVSADELAHHVADHFGAVTARSDSMRDAMRDAMRDSMRDDVLRLLGMLGSQQLIEAVPARGRGNR